MPLFAILEPRKLLATDILVNAVHDSLQLDFTDSLTTIREAVHLANRNDGPSRITFAPELNGQTISVGSELNVEGVLSLDSLFDVTISGEGQTRVFAVAETGDFDLSGITIADGVSESGAAIRNDGKLTVREATFERNSATIGGAIHNTGILEVKNSLFVQNTATVWGSAIYTQQDEHMGDLLASSTNDLPIVGDNRDGSFNNGDQGDFVVGRIPSTKSVESFSAVAVADDLNLVFQRDPVFGDANVVASADAVDVGVTIDEPVDPDEPGDETDGNCEDGDDHDDGSDGNEPDPVDRRTIKLGYRFVEEVIGDGGEGGGDGTADDDGGPSDDGHDGCDEGHDGGN